MVNSAAASAAFVPDACKQVFTAIDELRALNESTIGFEVVDYTPQASRILWANEAALNVVFKRPLEELAKIDLNNGLSKGLREHSDFLWNAVQVNKETKSEIKTVYLGGMPATYHIVHRPLDLVLPDTGEQRTVILNQWQPVDEGISDERQQWRLAAELFLQMDVKTVCFDAGTLHVRFQNAKSSAFYSAANARIQNFTEWLDTFDVDDPGVDVSDAAELKAKLAACMQGVRMGAEPVAFECRSRLAEMRAAGSGGGVVAGTVWHRVRCSACMDPLNGRAVLLVQELDITELKEIELHLVKEQDDMEQFFASVSHELRSPLNGIIGLASAVAGDKECSARLRKTIKLIESSGQRMVSLVSDIVDSAALKRRTLLIKHESVDLAEVASVVCDVLAPIVPRKVRLVNQIEAGFPSVEGDTGRISQVLTNLVSNAIKFTHDGLITVSAHDLPDTNKVVIAVTDTGIGIAADKLEFLWDAFKQVDRQTTRRYGGTGLGLFLVKDLVTAHNGTVEVESRRGQGSTFSVTLPKTQDADPDHSAPSSLAFSRRSRSSICLHSASPEAGEPRACGVVPPMLREMSEGERSRFGRSRLASWQEAESSDGREGARGEGGDKGGGLNSRKAWRGAGAFRHTQGSFRGLAVANEEASHEEVAALRGQVGSLTASLNQERKKHEELRVQLESTNARAHIMAQQIAAEQQRCSGLEQAVRELKAALEETGELRRGASSDRRDDTRISASLQSCMAGKASGGSSRTSSNPTVGPQEAPQRIGSDGGAGSERRRRHSVASHYSDMHGQLEVLAVDDDPVNQMVIEALLEPNGFKVTSAMDGQEALDILASRQYLPDIVLLDCQMPIKSGFEVCQELRQSYPESLPIIMISANTDEDNIVRGFKVGSNDYVKKPFNRHEVLARIETQIKLRDTWRTEVEAARSNELLGKILPLHVARRLKAGHTMVSDSHQQVTILFSDVVGFTNMAAQIETSDLITLLNNMFTQFDRLIDVFGVYKVETIGDAYMIAAGHEESSRNDHCTRVFNMAKAMIAACRRVQLPPGVSELRIRIGMHSGPAYAGVVGEKCPRYCFFGDTVNTASRMESHGFPMCIHVSEPTMQLLADAPEGWAEYGTRDIKGKGAMTTYLARIGAWEDALDLRFASGGLHPRPAPPHRNSTLSRPASSEGDAATASKEGSVVMALSGPSPDEAPSPQEPRHNQSDDSDGADQRGGGGGGGGGGSGSGGEEALPVVHAARRLSTVCTHDELSHVTPHNGLAAAAEPPAHSSSGEEREAEGGAAEREVRGILLERLLAHERVLRETAEKRERLASSMLRQRDAHTLSLLHTLTGAR